ncbi:hypothetical protein ACFY0P_37885 [Streptomyces sp. NPDC001714]|uniref:hypothetical protein n=1 Tax=Streptomyces sp. NPDC001714 TaxID=3364603 RepID=UPI00368A9C3B
MTVVRGVGRHLIRRLRRRSRGNDITHTQLNVVRQHLRAAVYLLDWLTDQGLTMASCRQSDLERWMTRDETQLRKEAGHFVRWTVAQRIARDLSFPAVKWNGPSQAMDDDARWATARRLLNDDTIRTEYRLAGLLLLLYAQWPAAISRLTTAHIEKTDEAVRIRLGDVAVTLPSPVAELALEQSAARRSHAVLAQTDSPWLFPGGQPGRPISAWAMGERLRKLGIRLAETRSTALFQLATELPSAILARTPAPAASTTLLVLSVGGKGIVMRPGHLREATRKAAQRATRTFRSRLSAGEKTCRKRMATLAVVHDADPAVRRPHDIIAPPGASAASAATGTTTSRTRPSSSPTASADHRTSGTTAAQWHRP